MAKSFIDALINQKIINHEQAKQIEGESRVTGESFGGLLSKKALLSEEKLLEIRSQFFNLPIKQFQKGEKIIASTLREIPEDTARFYKIAPLNSTEDILDVGIMDPENLVALEALKFIGLKLRKKIKIFLISQQDFNNILKDYRTLRGEVTEVLQKIGEKLGARQENNAAPSGGNLAEISEEAPITKIVSVLLRHAVEGKASDIHLEPVENSLKARFRLDGVLYTSLILPINIHPEVVARIKILSNLKIDETRIPQDGRFRIKLEERNIDFRVSTFPSIFGEKVVMRILDPSATIQTLEGLGIDGKNKELVLEGIVKPFGLILITGPTGSGKSTTLYVGLNLLNKEALNVVTIEDPVEYWIQGVNQSQVRPELNYTFSSGLRSILRQDPDIIMVGEVRDRETADLVIHASLTGHLVFSTLHTNNAVGAIPRLIDMGIDKFLIPATLDLIIAQRLVRRLCEDCKEKIKAPQIFEKIISENIANLPKDAEIDFKISKPYQIFQAKGCKNCGFKGTKGRIGIFEVLKMTNDLEKVILDKPSESVIIEEAKKQGMITMRQDGILKALKGIILLEEALRETE